MDFGKGEVVDFRFQDFGRQEVGYCRKLQRDENQIALFGSRKSAAKMERNGETKENARQLFQMLEGVKEMKDALLTHLGKMNSQFSS